MSYSVGQYNFVSTPDRENFLSAISDGFVATRYPMPSNYGVDGTSDSDLTFNEECLHYAGAVNSGFEKGVTYYLHCRILQLDSTQVFNLRLVHRYPAAGEEDETQFLKRIVVQKAVLGEAKYNTNTREIEIEPGNNWVDLELVFTPILSFDTLVFDLLRTMEAKDYEEKYRRCPCIIYNELSIVRNPLTPFADQEINVIKIGVQSHPGLLMVINNEPIKIGRSGSYELRSELLNGIDKFAVAEAAKDDNFDKVQEELAFKNTADILSKRHEPIAYRSRQTYAVLTIAEYEELSPYRKLAYDPILVNEKYDPFTWEIGEDSPSSLCRLGVNKVRETSSFVLDYMYGLVEDETEDKLDNEDPENPTGGGDTEPTVPDTPDITEPTEPDVTP